MSQTSSDNWCHCFYASSHLAVFLSCRYTPKYLYCFHFPVLVLYQSLISLDFSSQVVTREYLWLVESTHSRTAWSSIQFEGLILLSFLRIERFFFLRHTSCVRIIVWWWIVCVWYNYNFFITVKKSIDLHTEQLLMSIHPRAHIQAYRVPLLRPLSFQGCRCDRITIWTDVLFSCPSCDAGMSSLVYRDEWSAQYSYIGSSEYWKSWNRRGITQSIWERSILKPNGYVSHLTLYSMKEQPTRIMKQRFVWPFYFCSSSDCILLINFFRKKMICMIYSISCWPINSYDYAHITPQLDFTYLHCQWLIREMKLIEKIIDDYSALSVNNLVTSRTI
jgi:hypothetical protein